MDECRARQRPCGEDAQHLCFPRAGESFQDDHRPSLLTDERYFVLEQTHAALITHNKTKQNKTKPRQKAQKTQTRVTYSSTIKNSKKKNTQCLKTKKNRKKKNDFTFVLSTSSLQLSVVAIALCRFARNNDRRGRGPLCPREETRCCCEPDFVASTRRVNDHANCFPKNKLCLVIHPRYSGHPACAEPGMVRLVVTKVDEKMRASETEKETNLQHSI